MKKTFISPVAQFVATETENDILATSTINVNNNPQSGESTTNPGGEEARQNGITNAANPINTQALDF